MVKPFPFSWMIFDKLFSVRLESMVRLFAKSNQADKPTLSSGEVLAHFLHHRCHFGDDDQE